MGDAIPTEMKLLAEVERTPQTSQRSLARRMGIALGITNMLLRNLVQKGYVRATRAGWRRWLYTLTPSGISRKLHLTVAYIHRILAQYEWVRDTLRERLVPLELHEESRVALYGTGEFAELVYLGLKEQGVEQVDIFGQPGTPVARFIGMPVRDLSTLKDEEYDHIMITFLNDAHQGVKDLRARGLDPGKLVTFFPEITLDQPSEEDKE